MLRNRVREIRKAKKLTLEQLADMTDLSVSQISRIETNDRGWSVESLAAIAKALGVEVAELIDATDAWTEVAIFGWVGENGSIRAVPNSATSHLPPARLPAAFGDILALAVSGATQYPRYFEGDIIAVAETPSSPQECVDRECMVTTEGGQAFLKTPQKGSEPGRWHLMAHNQPPMLDIAIETCRPVLYVARAR